MRWLLVPLGLAVAAAAAWLLLSAPAGDPAPARVAPPDVASEPPARRLPRLPGAPMGDIDEASREKLDRVLEREGVGP